MIWCYLLKYNKALYEHLVVIQSISNDIGISGLAIVSL